MSEPEILHSRQRIARFVANLKRWSQIRSELERRLEELGASQAIARAINLSLPLEEILQATLDQIVALVRADAGYLSLRHPSGQGLLSFALRGASPQLAELFADQELVARLDSKIEAHSEPVFIHDIHLSPTRELVPAPVLQEGYTSLLFTALRSRAKVQGAIVLAAREAGRFGAGEAALLRSLSEQVGVALDNACLYAEARKRAEEMRSLYDLSPAAASLDPGDILHLIGERIMRLFRAACFFVALVDEEKDLLHFAHLIDQEQVLTPFSVPIKEEGGLTGYVLNAGQPLLITDLAAEAGSLPVQPIHFGEAARSWLGVPLVVKGRAIGVMSVQAYVPAAFDEDDQRLLSMAAQQAASALENARLFQETLTLERRYHALLEQLNDGYAVLQDGRLVFANARLGHMLGLAPEALLASSLEELLAHEERQNGALPAVPREPGSEPIHYRTHFQKSDGSALPVEVTLHWIEYEDRPALAVLCRDISSQVRLETQLIQAEKLSAVGQLVSGVAHELNNPLTTIKGYVQLMRGERLPPAMTEDLRRVEEAADRCRRIVRDLLTFARRYEPEFTDTDVNELLQRTAALRSYELRVRNIAVQWDLDPVLPTIEADPHRLQQVVLNLIFNAEQALLGAGERGVITIRSRTLPRAQGIRFEVADNGPGIRPEHLDRIFDPFFTTKEVGTGTGLGLSISYGIVKEHGGRIWAESRPGEGATFLIELPLVVQQGNAAD